MLAVMVANSSVGAFVMPQASRGFLVVFPNGINANKIPLGKRAEPILLRFANDSQ
jgi:hypothetical protein